MIPKMESFLSKGSAGGILPGLDDLGTVRAMTTLVDLEKACLRILSLLLENSGQDLLVSYV